MTAAPVPSADFSGQGEVVYSELKFLSLSEKAGMPQALCMATEMSSSLNQTYQTWPIQSLRSPGAAGHGSGVSGS